MAIKEDTGVSASQLTYGTDLRVPRAKPLCNIPELVRDLDSALREFGTRARRHDDFPVYGKCIGNMRKKCKYCTHMLSLTQ